MLNAGGLEVGLAAFELKEVIHRIGYFRGRFVSDGFGELLIVLRLEDLFCLTTMKVCRFLLRASQGCDHLPKERLAYKVSKGIS